MIRNSTEVCKQLLEDNLDELTRVSRMVARSYKKRCSWVDIQDLEQACWTVFAGAATRFDTNEGTPFAGYAQSSAYRSLKTVVHRAGTPVPGSNLVAMKTQIRTELAGHCKDDPSRKGYEPVVDIDYGAALDRKRYNQRLRPRIWRLIGAVALESALDAQTVFDLAVKDLTPTEAVRSRGLDRKTALAVARKARDMIARDPKVCKLWREA